MSEKMITETLETFGLYELEGPILNAISKLSVINAKHLDKKISIELRTQEYSDSKEYAITYQRPENEKEKAKREKEESQSKEYRRKQYEYLKKEFEPH